MEKDVIQRLAEVIHVLREFNALTDSTPYYAQIDEDYKSLLFVAINVEPIKERTIKYVFEHRFTKEELSITIEGNAIALFNDVTISIKLPNK